VEKAESGSRLVNDAGTTMQELLTGVTQARALIAGIAQAGREQSQSPGEVHIAITEVDAVTQQNAALVKQTTATAGSLKEQSQHLAETIGKFKIKAWDPVPQASAPRCRCPGRAPPWQGRHARGRHASEVRHNA
jgi:methyl-accepting chemotaxis protein